MVSIEARRQNRVYRAIADPTRRDILKLLRGGGQTVGEIAGNFRISRPAVSKHLRMLRTAGLVSFEKQGTATRCTLRAKPLKIVDDWLRDYEAFWSDTLQNLKAHMEKNECPRQ